MNRVVGLLLAGGAASRFGSNKLMAPLDGVPLGLIAARRLAAVADELLVVVPPDRPSTRALFEREFRVSVCDDAREGLGHSLAHGVACTRDADGWLIALADMPFIRHETFVAVKNALVGPQSIARPCRAGQAGHPVGFGAGYAAELIALRGDSGAAAVVRRHPAALELVEVDDPGIVLDIDRPSDLAAAAKALP